MHTESHTNKCTPCSSMSDHKGNTPVWSPCHQSLLGLLGLQRTWYPRAQAKNLGAIFHSFLPFISYISAFSKSCQLYLHQYFREYPNKSLIIESTSELSSLGLPCCLFFSVFIAILSKILWKSLPLSRFFFFFLTKQIVATSSRRDLWSGSFQISLIMGIFPSFSQGSMVGCVHIAQC